MTFERYKEEVALSLAQIGLVEVELMTLFAEIFRSTCTDLSLRDVSTLRLTHQKEYQSQSGYPDFVILSRNAQSKQPLGCVELKAMNQSISPNVDFDLLHHGVGGYDFLSDKLDEILSEEDFHRIQAALKENDLQFVHHIYKFHNVLYCNGLDWYYFSEGCLTPQWKVQLGVLDSAHSISWSDEESWEELKTSLTALEKSLIPEIR